MINKLSREFAQKTEKARKELYMDLLCCPVMHTDATNARENESDRTWNREMRVLLQEMIHYRNSLEAERLLRCYKRKQQQAMSFRSFEAIECLCMSMSVLIRIRQKEETNVFDRVSEIFE